MPMFIRKIVHAVYLKIMTVVVFFAPSSRHTVFAGTGSSSQLCEHIIRTGAKKVLVVTDKPLRELGVVDRAIAALLAADVDIAYYDGVLPDPTFDQVTVPQRLKPTAVKWCWPSVAARPSMRRKSLPQRRPVMNLQQAG